MAALITEATGQPVTLTRGGRGEFTVRVGDLTVASKSPDGFPDEDQAVEAVRAALG